MTKEMNSSKKEGSAEAQLRRLAEMRHEPLSDALRQEVRQAIGSKVSYVVARAADAARTRGLKELIPDLLAAFDRFMLSPAKTDKGCEAKLAIIIALHELDHDDASVFLRGIHHVQMEPAFGGPVDTAPNLRAASAQGLARQRRREALLDLLPLLTDPEALVRAAAARAVAATGREEGQLLLRLKILVGDREPEVVAECFAALLQLAGREALAFVGGFLDSSDEALRESAALALGASRLGGVLPLLRGRMAAGMDERFLQAILTAMATLRDEGAYDYLLELIRDGPQRLAAGAIEALKLNKADERLKQKIASAVDRRDERALREGFEKAFG